MAKYFSQTKKATNGYGYSDIAMLLSNLKDSETIFKTDEYKKMLTSVALLLEDKKSPTYMDLSGFRNENKQCWESDMTALELIRAINKDIFAYTKERAQQRQQ